MMEYFLAYSTTSPLLDAFMCLFHLIFFFSLPICSIITNICQYKHGE